MTRHTSIRFVGLILAALCLAIHTPTAQAQAKGKRYALLIGVTEYDHASLPDLKYTENDVEELAKLLQLPMLGFDKVVVLTTSRGTKNASAKPTAENIRKELKGLLAKATKHDTIFFAFSGHGIQHTVTRNRKDVEEAFICPANARPSKSKDPDEVQKTLIGFGEIFKTLDESGIGLKILIADACRNAPEGVKSADLESLPRPSLGTGALFSCKSGQRSYENAKFGKGHGAFFYHVLEGLRGKAKNTDNEVTAGSLAEYVIRSVTRSVPVVIGGGAKQTPAVLVNWEGEPPVLVKLADVVIPVAPESDFDKTYKQVFAWKETMSRAEAVKALHKMAGKDSVHAKSLLSICYQMGYGVEVDAEEAQTWGKRAHDGIKALALKGDTKAMMMYGWQIRGGLGVDGSDKEAAKWFRKAADKDDAVAQWVMSLWYRDGVGVEKDVKEAVRYARKAAEQDLALAQTEYGRMYENGTGVDIDFDEAAKWYRKSAAKKEPFGMNNLGVFYRDGKSVGKDAKEAVKWFRLASATGLPLGQANLGYMYDVGQGVEQDYKEAVRLYTLAANKNNVTAQYNLGLCYRDGRGVPKDSAEALKWFKKAAENGDDDAKKRVMELEK